MTPSKYSSFYAKHLLIASLALLTQNTFAVELRPIEFTTGTAGQIQTLFEIHNQSNTPIECIAQLAHWYSAPLLSLAPSETDRVEFWFDPAKGVINLLNVKNENMPIESMWCGLAGRAYESRSLLTLNSNKYAQTDTHRFICRDSHDSLICESTSP